MSFLLGRVHCLLVCGFSKYGCCVPVGKYFFSNGQNSRSGKVGKDEEKKKRKKNLSAHSNFSIIPDAILKIILLAPSENFGLTVAGTRG